jgi:hypothetical protein
VRSASTSAGETDVLITYRSADPDRSLVAILIEDKIRAAFQKDQAERYRDRGKEGEQARPKHWNYFFTCLVAPERYASGNAGFDARVSLEAIHRLFSADDFRTRFKAAAFQRALSHFGSTGGVQNPDGIITAFRAFYARKAEQFFRQTEVQWETARVAWRDDTWFNFRSSQFLREDKIIYKPKMGSVELHCGNSSDTELQEVLTKCSDRKGITTRPTGKSAAYCILIDEIHDFSDPEAVKPVVEQSFVAVQRLAAFFVANTNLLKASGGS